MATNNFKPFATGANANVTSQEDWESLTARENGFQAGKASSAQVNKAIRQATTIAALVGQFIADNSGKDVVDDGDLSSLLSHLETALERRFNDSIPAASLTEAGISQLSNATDSDDETLAATPKAVKAVTESCVSKSGDKMTGQLKINAVNALRIFDTDYGLIFRRSENNLWMIPTIKGQGESGDIGELRPIRIDLSTGLVTMGNSAKVEGSLGLGTESILGDNSIALGDNDTGFKQNGDGVLDVYANNEQVFRFQNGTLTSNIPLQVSGDIISNAWIYAERFAINSTSTMWIGMRDQNVIFGRNAIHTDGAQALLRQDHADRKYFIGGLGNQQFGIYMINNTRSENGTDGQAFMDSSGNWLCGGQMQPGDFSNFDSRYPAGDWISAVGLIANDETSPYVRARASNNLVRLATKDFVNSRSAVAGSRDAWWYKDEATGFIIQGGVVNRSGYVTSVGFPRAYVRECFSVQMTLTYTYGSLGNSGTNIQARDVGNTGFNACMCDNEQTAYWFAVGV